MMNNFQRQKIYVNCINCILMEKELSTSGIDDIKQGFVLIHLVDILWPQANLISKIKDGDEATAEDKIQTVLEYLSTIGVKHTSTVKGLVEGDLKATLEVLWQIFLNCCVHTPRLSVFQRNVKIGKRSVLNWCREKLPSLTVNHTNTLVENLCRGCALIDVLSAITNVKHDSDTTVHLTNCLEAIQEEYGVSKNIVSPDKVVACNVEEEVLLIYLALLKRKVKQQESKQVVASTSSGGSKPKTVIMKDGPPTRLAWTL